MSTSSLPVGGASRSSVSSAHGGGPVGAAVGRPTRARPRRSSARHVPASGSSTSGANHPHWSSCRLTTTTPFAADSDRAPGGSPSVPGATGTATWRLCSPVPVSNCRSRGRSPPTRTSTAMPSPRARSRTGASPSAVCTTIGSRSSQSTTTRYCLSDCSTQTTTSRAAAVRMLRPSTSAATTRSSPVATSWASRSTLASSHVAPRRRSPRVHVPNPRRPTGPTARLPHHAPVTVGHHGEVCRVRCVDRQRRGGPVGAHDLDPAGFIGAVGRPEHVHPEVDRRDHGEIGRDRPGRRLRRGRRGRGVRGRCRRDARRPVHDLGWAVSEPRDLAGQPADEHHGHQRHRGHQPTPPTATSQPGRDQLRDVDGQRLRTVGPEPFAKVLTHGDHSPRACPSAHEVRRRLGRSVSASHLRWSP